jgi:DNA-binding transcriptional LysR family regulator
MNSAALNGAGVVYTTEESSREEANAGTMEIVLKQFTPTSSGFHLYYPKRSQVLPHKLRACIDHLKASAVSQRLTE